MKRHFKDTRHWNRLAEVHLEAYHLPKWAEPCTVESMSKWLHVLNLESRYAKECGPVEEFIERNDWPLRAFVGLALEMKDEGALP